MLPVTEIKEIIRSYPEIKLFYFFGSRASGRINSLSDYDFAIYLNEKTSLQRQKEIILELIVKFSLLLKSNNIDIVMLNKKLSPLLKYMIIKEGKIIYEQIPYRLLVEPSIYSEYLDFQVFKKVNQL